MALTARPVDGHGFGVRLRGISHDSLDDADVRRQLRRALAEHGLVILEDIEPSDRLQRRVGEVFGPLKQYPASGCADAEPGVAKMTAGPENSTVVEIGGERLAGWMPWHFDQCYMPRPNSARVLRCGQGVPSGGLTGFIDGAELYDNIDPGVRDRIARCEIGYALNMAFKDLRFGIPADFRIVRQLGAGADDLTRRATHPAVRVASTGRNILHVSPWMTTGIAGGADDDADELLEDVAQEIARLSTTLAYFHRWQPSEMLVWDNLRLLHASSGFTPGLTRVMHRTTVEAVE